MDLPHKKNGQLTSWQKLKASLMLRAAIQERYLMV